MRRIITVFRWAAAIGCLIVCIKQFAAAFKMTGLEAFPFLLFGFVMLISSLILISPEIAGCVGGFFSKFLTGIIYPNDKNVRPPLSYRMARIYVQKLRYSEAIEEYQKIIYYYPKEQDAYLELLAVARGIGNQRLYQKYTRKFQKKFKSDPVAKTDNLTQAFPAVEEIHEKEKSSYC